MIPIGGDYNIEYQDAKDASDDTALTSGTCTFALKTSDGTAVSGGTGSLTHVASGSYLGILDSAITSTLTDGAQYRIEITFSQGNYNDFRRVIDVARYRGPS